MHLKRYRRENVKEALRAVREELGPQALVLSTRLVSARGVRGWFGRREIEVTAAAERTTVSAPRHVDAPARSDRGLDEVAARLQAAGLEPAMARDVAKALPPGQRRGATLQNIRKTLEGQLAEVTALDLSFAPIEVFVGPPGVGKTTTIAKLAAQERARFGRRLTLVAADGFRVGAVEQLRLFADILGTTLTVARSPRELEDALHTGKRPMLVDTAGRSPSDQGVRDMFRVLSGRSDVRTHLVLAANTPLPAARKTLERFADARPTRLVLTKVDEAESLAPLVALLREYRLPLSYLGTGQCVPEDLERATPPVLAAWIAGDDRQGAVA